MAANNKEEQRGVFPGLKFFTNLSEIAKNATTQIQQINRELSQPSTKSIPDGSIWNDLHKEYNKAHNQSIYLRESLSKEPMLSKSLDAFNTMLKWINLETDRIEKQLSQFGYQPDTTTDYEYHLPLTPQQQEIYDKEHNKINQHQNNNNDDNNNKPSSMQIDSNNDNNNGDHVVDDEEDEDEDVDMIKNQPNKNEIIPINNKKSDLNETENKNKINENNTTNTKSNTNSVQITPKNIITKKPRKMIATTPKTPGLEDFGFSSAQFKSYYYNKSSITKNVGDKNSKKESAAASSSISTVTPSVSLKEGQNGSCLLETPIFDAKMNLNIIRNCNNNDNDKNKINFNDSILSNMSIPSLPSPINDNNALQPITPFNYKKSKLSNTNNNNVGSNKKTPITVSYFSLQQKTHNKSSTNDQITEIEENENKHSENDGDNDKNYGMKYFTQNELNDIPSWISSQIGNLDEVNKNIDRINKSLKSRNGRITKQQFSDLMENETPFILLLTRTNRLKSDWYNGDSIYILIT